MIMIKCFFLILCIGFFLGYDCVEPEKKKAEMKKYLNRVKKKEGKIILTNGNEHYEGNVEIFHNGVWGSVCDDEWDMKDAMVVCKQLGFGGVKKITHGSHFGRAAETFWMDNLFCTGTEKHLSDCHFEGWGLSDCNSTEAAGVICDPFGNSSTTTEKPKKKIRISIKEFLKSDLQVRLMGGRIAGEGRVEVKQMNSDVLIFRIHFPKSSTKIMTNLMVNMSAKLKIRNFQYSPMHTGSPDEIPNSVTRLKVEMFGSYYENRLAGNIIAVLRMPPLILPTEVNHCWGVICGDSWTILEATVVCRMLGLNFASYAAQSNFFGGNSSAILMSGIRCRGNEINLDQCTIETASSSECLGREDRIAGVICSSNLPDLIIDTKELEQSSYIEDRQLYNLQCAMEENCLASSAYRIQRDKKTNWHLQTRRLLRFTAKITNIGNTDFRPIVPKYMWEYHQCHRHYHSMEIFATFDVLDQGGEKVAEGHKASFCLEDNECTGKAGPVFACADFGDQGISVNCSDIYRHNIDCQWVDISELNPGLYSFKVSVNPEFKVAEMSYANNIAICSMYYAETFVRIYNCYTQHL